MSPDRNLLSWLRRKDVPSTSGDRSAASEAPTLWPEVDPNRGPHDAPGQPMPRAEREDSQPNRGESGTL